MALTPTTTAALEDLFKAQILATTPRIAYQGAAGWKLYERQVQSAAQTRRFRLVWGEGLPVRGGIFTNQSMEVIAELAVRTDYVGQHQELGHLRQDDLHQIRDRLHELAADPDNGLVLVQTISVRPVALEPSTREAASKDAAAFDLRYQVRYLLARG